MKKPNRYYVVYKIEDEYYPHIESAMEIFNKMDMSDCYDISVERICLINNSKLIPCRFRNTWHDPREPLRMQIENKRNGTVYNIGYGSDH